MSETPKNNRRDFLKGRAAVDALQAQTDQLLPAEPPTGIAAPRPQAASYLVQIARRAMATDFQIYLNAGQYPHGADVALQALDLVESLEDQMTVYREHSEVSQINRRAARGTVLVERRLCDLLAQAVQLHDETDGAFDITSGPLSKLWGFYRREGRFPTQEEIDQAITHVGSRWLELDSVAQSIHFKQRGVEINLGSIGKGYALDRCAEIMAEGGIEDFLIHGGKSSILGRGSRAREHDRPGWSVALSHPLKQDQRLAEIWLHDAAVGTSGAGNQFFRHKGRRYGHVLDPRTGWPAEGVLSSTVLTTTAARADALATAFYVMGLAETRKYCETRPDISAILVCEGRRTGGIQIFPINIPDERWQPYDRSAVSSD